MFLACYHHLFDSAADIDFLYGGRDSGKSKFIAQWLVYLCLKLPYFRCVLARKVFNTIKDSQWQFIKDVCEEWKVEHLFKFTVAPLEIKCVNGNRFICRGMDEPGKLKSLTNPSHAWVEEGNQLTLDEFIILMTSMRYNQGNCKTWFSFNPECEGDYKDFWLYKIFYANADVYTLFKSSWSIPYKDGIIEYNYQSTHTTYINNPYCKPVRIAFLTKLEEIDPYHYLVYTLGKWGNIKTDDPFCICYDRAKHVRPTVLNKRQEVYLSFDFNVNPITCGVYQHDGPGLNIRVIQAIQLANSDIYKLCEYINLKYTNCIFMVTGDATGQNTTALVQDGINYYTVIKTKLRLSRGQLKVPTINPRVKENRVLVNAVFSQCNVVIDPENAKGLIFDCENVSVNEVGDIDKGSRSNPKKRADNLDHLRYYLNAFHKTVLLIT